MYPRAPSPAAVQTFCSHCYMLQDNVAMGVAGSVELLNSRVISSQPIVSFDWSPDREGLCCLSCLDQTVRVYIVTKLGKF